MKQQITIEQLNELPYLDKLKLKNWCILKNPNKKEYDELSLSIGQMMEFLSNCASPFEISLGGYGRYLWEIKAGPYKFENKELCDAIWQAVKDVL